MPKYLPQHAVLQRPWNYAYVRNPAELFLTQIEKCGRKCYKSEDKITPESAYPFVKRVVNIGHFSVTEFGTLDVLIEDDSITETTILTPWTFVFVKGGFKVLSTSLRELLVPTCGQLMNDVYQKILYYTFGDKKVDKDNILDLLLNEIETKFEDKFMFPPIPYIPKDVISPFPTNPHRVIYDIRTSRSITHEAVRHRYPSSFLQESQRYVRALDSGSLQLISWATQYGDKVLAVSDELDKLFTTIENVYNKLLKAGLSPQEARIILPNQTKTELLFLNYVDYFSSWWNPQRNSNKADPAMHKLAAEMHAKLRMLYPI